MQALILESPGSLEWQDVPEPDLRGPGEALVAPVAVATCDLDIAIATGLAPVPGPIAMGHEGIARVVAAGSDVTSVAEGDLVVVPFQISCGRCERCARGMTGDCLEVPERAMYGFGPFGGDFGGFLADTVRVPFADAMLVPLPDGIDPVGVASASDNLPDAWRTVAPHLAARPGADVLISGGGARSIGLYAVGIARALGAGRIDYVDTDPRRLAVAADLGAETHDVTPERVEGWPIVVDAGSSRESLASCCTAAEPGGYVTHVGILYEPETPIPLLAMYTRGVTLHTGRVMARTVIEPVLELVASGRLEPSLVTDRVLGFAQAGPALLEPHDKLVFTPAL
jgi:alcohol dehydrogenase